MKKLETSYRGIDYAGEVTCVGTVTGKRIEGGTGLVELDIEFRDADGNVTTPGKATVALSMRGK